MILIFIGLSALLLGCLGFFLYVIYRYVPIIERNAFEVPRHQIPLFPEKPFEGRKIFFELDGNGQAIPVHYMPATDSTTRRLVVFCHETGADWQSWMKHASFLPQEGMDVLSFDYNRKDEAFQWPNGDEAQRLRVVLDWIAREKKGFRVALFGVSKGSSIALANADHPVVGALVLDGIFSTYATLERYMRKWVGIYVMQPGSVRRIPRWVYAWLARLTVFHAGLKKRLRFFSIEPFIRSLRKPFFVIHAGKDPFVRLEDVRRILNQAAISYDLWVCEGAGHSESAHLDPRLYRVKVTAFLSKTLCY